MNLPDNIIDLILNYLPLYDKHYTSIELGGNICQRYIQKLDFVYFDGCVYFSDQNYILKLGCEIYKSTINRIIMVNDIDFIPIPEGYTGSSPHRYYIDSISKDQLTINIFANPSIKNALCIREGVALVQTGKFIIMK